MCILKIFLFKFVLSVTAALSSYEHL